MRLIFLTWVFVLIFTALYAASALPSSFEFHELTTADSVRIRAGHFCGDGAIAEESTDKVIFVLPGRVSRIERHEFLAKQFAKSGFSVWLLDFRGQGGSQGLVDNQQMVHVDNFNEYLHDVEALMHLARFAGQRKFLYGHSMGGQVALQVMQNHPSIFEAAVLEAPMLRIKTAPIPYFLSAPIAYVMTNWLGRGKQYCLGRGDYDVVKESFEHNRNCRDRDLFDQHFFIPESHKELIPDGPSWGWLHAAFSVTRNLLSALAHLRAVRTKVFIATASDDKVLDTSFDATVASTLSGAHCVYPGAWHCLLHDTLDTRRDYLAHLSDFLSHPDDFISAHRAVAPARTGWVLWLWSLRGSLRVQRLNLSVR
jgi:lysophospholipase